MICIHMCIYIYTHCIILYICEMFMWKLYVHVLHVSRGLPTKTWTKPEIQIDQMVCSTELGISSRRGVNMLMSTCRQGHVHSLGSVVLLLKSFSFVGFLVSVKVCGSWVWSALCIIFHCPSHALKHVIVIIYSQWEHATDTVRFGGALWALVGTNALAKA